MRVTGWPRLAAAAGLCLLLAASVITSPGVGGNARAGQTAAGTRPQLATVALTWQAVAFLATYVRRDGRVSRPDQGNDTVSEGQAYALLLAEATGNQRLFTRVWQWTRAHLQRDDGLFVYHAGPAGQIWGAAPATDADLLIAWALLRYRGTGAAALHRAGAHVARAVLAHEVTTDPDGMPILTAGPWATGSPATLDPSYWSLPALAELARLTGDDEWQQLADSAVHLTWQVTQGGRRLPPDWAELTAGGHLLPEAAPKGSQGAPRYGLDAQRTVAWFAASCDPRARTLAARWWRLLRTPARHQALALQLDGTVLDPTRAVLPLVAAAAAADAAHAEAQSRGLLSLADRQLHQHPGYYGAAWEAFGPLLIRSQVLNGC